MSHAGHGTPGRYRKGCRCDFCKEAHRIASADYEERRRNGDFIPLPRKPKPVNREQETKNREYLAFIDASACRQDRLEAIGLSVEIFDADTPRNPNAAVAIAICGTCPVIDQCPTHLVNRHTDGVRAGQVWSNGHVATGRRR